MAEAYCVKDKRKVEVVNPQRITMKNGKPALQGTCPICGNKVFRIGGADLSRHTSRRSTTLAVLGGGRFLSARDGGPSGPRSREGRPSGVEGALC